MLSHTWCFKDGVRTCSFDGMDANACGSVYRTCKFSSLIHEPVFTAYGCSFGETNLMNVYMSCLFFQGYFLLHEQYAKR